MTVPTLISDRQKAFIDDMGVLLKCMPLSVKRLAELAGLKETELKGFISEKHGISDMHLSKLEWILSTDFEYVDEVDFGFYSYSLTGHQTLFANKRKHLIDVYECVAACGDMEYAFELLGPYGYRDNEFRMILIKCSGYYSLINVPKNNVFLDNVISNGYLMNFSNYRLTSDDVFASFVSHVKHVSQEPDRYLQINKEYFMDKDLLFSQIELCNPAVICDPDILESL